MGGQIVHAFVEEVLNGTVTNIQSGLSNTVASGVVQSGVLEASVEVAFSQAEVSACPRQGYIRFPVAH